MSRSNPAVLPPQLLEAIAARGGTRTYPAQTILINEDDQSDSIYIIVSGRVKAYGSDDKGREVFYNAHGPGEYVGELSLDGGARSASVVTLEPTTCVLVPGAQVRDFFASHPDFALHLVHKLIDLARRSTRNVKSLALNDVYGRIVRVLEELARDEEGQRVVAERLSQQDIADRVGSSREMVSRIFKQLVSGGYVALEARRIVLLKKLPSGW